MLKEFPSNMFSYMSKSHESQQILLLSIDEGVINRDSAEVDVSAEIVKLFEESFQLRREREVAQL
jgi:hypothetical protein